MEELKNIETEFIKDGISRCESVDELIDEIFPMLKSQREMWSGKINEIIKESHLKKSEFAQECGISRQTLNKWCKGSIPRNRSTYIKIGMVAGYEVGKINKLLTRYGRYPALYSKTLEDCICIFVSTNYKENLYEKYTYILKRIKDNLEKGDALFDDISTVIFDDKLAQVKNEAQMQAFIAENIDIFSHSYYKFYAYIKMCIESNIENDCGSVYEMALTQNWSSSLRQCVSAIYQKKWFPTRNKIISLGLHLNMDHDQVDFMLELAHMEPLCAKNIFESVIMFILDDAELNDMLNRESRMYDPDWQLYQYARQIIEQIDLPEMEDFIDELSIDEEEW